ncbi:DUF6086 family protein [Marinitenerispora sediminis]|uniref:Uncharacterized protein n=1 Tax=Marinitenerispora sediminis TaxID=1931232 RepID=A0A368SZV7_9ACTN|nr:DUF6086 family protein [Marinitenerispora sediminis]RCV51451.1 hypothetical protein DEF28_15380 [Marinitenerispora sediminis]RCV51904.1 hypothetical protein DEF24_22660 [Marinitenerispora sediminis]RCV55243.1 hypothetical protein DEF23_14615 [Marinitenerispora sediminis]
MSCFFQVGGLVLWNPSNTVARVFLGQARTLAPVVGRRSGLGDIVEDECEVDLTEFAGLVAAVLELYRRSPHPLLRALLDGFVPVALVLLERGGGTALGSVDGAAAWAEPVRAAARSMPRG